MAITSVRGEQLRDGDVEAVDLATNSVTTAKIADANVTIAKINFDHGDLGGTADDDHSQYVLADGTRSMSTLTVTGTSKLDGRISVGGVAVPSDAMVTVDGTLGTDPATGIDVLVEGTAASGTLYGIYVDPEIDTGGAAFGTVSDFYAASPNVTTGSITTAIGLYIENITAGSTNYGIYSPGTVQSYFGGNVRIVGSVLDTSGDAGTSGQILSSTGTGTNWIDNSVSNADTLDSLDSTAFFILNGQSGGQTAYGGSAASNDLVLLSTSNASKGNVIIATNAAENVGVGTVSPSQKLHVSGAMRLTAHFYDTDNNAGTNGQVLSSTGSATRWLTLDHGTSLAGLTDDDHTQYALLAGRSGGQTLIGGTASGDDLTLTSTSNATKGIIICNQSLFVNESANTKMTTGITINQDNDDDEIFALKSGTGGTPDVSHGMTTITEDDTFATMKKQSASGGGLELAGYHEGGGGINIRGIGVTDDPNKSTSAAAYAMIGASKKSGTSAGAAGADANILAVRNHTTTRWIVDAEGDTHRDGTDNTYDAWEDAELARAFDLVMSPASTIDSEFDRFVRYKRDDLIEAGLLSEGGFYNESRLLRLHNGAIWQMHCRIAELEQKLLEVNDRAK